MDNKEYIHKILNNIKDIDLTVDNFINYDKIPQIEIDLLLSKIQALYDEAIQLNRINSKNFSEKKFVVKEEEFELEIDEEPETITIAQTENLIIPEETPEKKESEFETPVRTPELDKKEVAQEESATIEDEMAEESSGFNSDHIEEFQQSVQELIEEEKEIENEPKKDIVPEKEVEKTEKTKKITRTKEKEKKEAQPQRKEIKEVEKKAEPVQDKSNSINDIINANQSGNVLANKLNKKPISNINSAIGLNDKFQYIRELFDGSADNYSTTVEKLNSFNDFDEAIKFIEQSFQWDTEDSVVIKFLEIVNRRYL